MKKKRYNFAPGPVPMEYEIQDVVNADLPYMRTKEFSMRLLFCEQELLKLFNAPYGARVVFLSGSGTAAMEASLLNLVSADDLSLVINGGSFAERFIDILKCQKKKYCSYDVPMGEDSDFNDLNLKGVDNLIVNGHETSTGVLYDVKSLGEKSKKENCNFFVDAISMTLTENIDMTSDNIDCLILSSHKAFGLHPGMSFVILSEKMVGVAIRNHNISSLYFNFSLYLKDGLRGQTPFTTNIGIIMQLEALLKKIKKVSSTYYFNKARDLALYFREKVKDLPVTLFSESPPNAMTSIIVDDGFDAKVIVEMLLKKNIYVADSGGDLKSKLIRISHMGNQNKDDIDFLVYEIKKIMEVY